MPPPEYEFAYCFATTRFVMSEVAAEAFCGGKRVRLPEAPLRRTPKPVPVKHQQKKKTLPQHHYSTILKKTISSLLFRKEREQFPLRYHRTVNYLLRMFLSYLYLYREREREQQVHVSEREAERTRLISGRSREPPQPQRHKFPDSELSLLNPPISPAPYPRFFPPCSYELAAQINRRSRSAQATRQQRAPA